MNHRPTFSIIVPVADSVPVADYATDLREALESLLAQSDPDWEALVVSDRATGTTAPGDTATHALEVMQDYARRDARFRLVYQEGGSRGALLNEGLRHAKGEWICTLSAGYLFARRKLEHHRRYIEEASPSLCFYTYSSHTYLAQHEEPREGERAPHEDGPAWQVLEMLRSDYIGATLCIQRDALAAVGAFDENLRYAHEYEIGLRLLLRHPAKLIPERTCLQRTRTGPGLGSLPEDALFEAARVAIDFLNQHHFEALVPFVDLTDPQKAKEAVGRALDVAAAYDSPVLYGLGPHPALLWRIIEFIFGVQKSDSATAIQLRTMAAKSIQGILQKRELDPVFRLYWKLAYATLRLPGSVFHYASLSSDGITMQRYWQLSAAKTGNYAALHRYLVQRGHILPAPGLVAPALPVGEVAIVCQKNTLVDGTIKYGAARAWMEAAHYLQRAGKPVVLIGISSNRLGVTEGVPFLGLQADDETLAALKLLSPFDTLIGNSRADIFPGVRVARPLVYHHGPHPPMGEFAPTVVRRLRLPVVVASQDSMNLQRRYDIPSELLHVVYYGYRPEIFYLGETSARHPRRIVFAGMGVFYKGLDIAVQAFAQLHMHYPDAEFHIYGENHRWPAQLAHLWPASWLDAEGYPNWKIIEQEVAGIHYGGEARPEELARAFRSASLLVMPSRVYETFGLVSIEAQACGCIPVLPRQGGFPETMREGITGYLYDQNSPDALAEKISELWEKQLPSTEQRMAAATWVRQQFSWQKTGEEIAGILAAIDTRKRQALGLEDWFWGQAIRWKIRGRELYRQAKSPWLRIPLAGVRAVLLSLQRRRQSAH